MAERRKIAAILVADVVGYSRLAGADEDGTLARLRALRSDLIDPAVAAHHGRTVKRTGDGSLIEFRSVVDAVRCAIAVQNGMIERNAGVPPERRIAAGCWGRGARPGRGRRLVFSRRKPNRARRDRAAACRASFHRRAALHQSLERSRPRLFRRRHNRKPHHGLVAHPRQFRDRAQHRFHIQGQEPRRQGDRQGAWRSLRTRRVSAT
jgi:hypothetical protein